MKHELLAHHCIPGKGCAILCTHASFGFLEFPAVSVKERTIEQAHFEQIGKQTYLSYLWKEQTYLHI